MLPILLCITFNLENMIVSNLQNSGRIESLHPQFKPLFDYVKTHDLLHAELGRIDIDGDDLELEKPDGRARIFVIAGGGLGRKSFRSLQRKGIPFATGIIYENDLDYPAAKALSAEIVSARSFEPVDDALIEKAKELIDACEGVICDRTEFGTYEQFNSRLYEYAVSTGKIIKIPFHEEQLAQL